MVNPFWNSREHRLRALIRMILQAAILVVILLGFEFLFSLIHTLTAGIASSAPTPSGVELDAIVYYISPVVTLIGFVASIYLAGKWLDHRPFSGFGFNLNRQWWQDMGFGLILGAGLMVFVFLAELTFGWIKVTGFFYTANPNASFFIGQLQLVILFVCVGIYEELFVRGYLLLNLAEGLNFRWLGNRGAVISATLVSSVIFSILHILNPGASWMSVINLFVSGILLASGYLLTGELAIPIGLHITWNFFQGAVFGFPVSGGTNQAQFIAIQQVGPKIWTGDIFGPEAGLIGLLAMIIGIIAIFWRKKSLKLMSSLEKTGME
jgi:membrane protease YdiL (CAAX protease family)